MAYRFLAAFLILFVFFETPRASVPLWFLKSSFPNAISGLKETVAKALGSQGEGLEIAGFDARDAFIGHPIVYDFHVEVDDKVFPISLLEDGKWMEVLYHPVFGSGEEGGKEVVETGRMKDSGFYPVIPPFQLAGPMELWIKDGDDMRLSLPHDVDAGVLKKVILSDGAVVTVKGAKSVSLRHPIELPLPFNHSDRKEHLAASSLLDLAEALRDASRSNEKALLSLLIEGPTSLTSSSTTSSRDKRLKLKRLAPGLVELSTPVTPAAPVMIEKSNALTMWPLVSLNGSDMNLRGIEELLASMLRDKWNKEGTFRLVKSEVSARTYLKLSFRITKRVLDGEVDWSGYPEWRTRPEKITSHFEVLARVEDKGELIPERIAEVRPFELEDTILDSVLTGNVTMSKVPIHYPPPSFFTL